MIRNYLTSVSRYISRNKGFTLINTLGLSIGMTACMLILQFVLHEFSYDDFHAKTDQIFRLKLERYDKGALSTEWASGAAGVGPDLSANFPEVKYNVRMRRSSHVIRYNEKFFKEDNLAFASEDFFEVFSVPLTRGVDSLVLKEPFKIVISESFASKYFAGEDPVGKVLTANGRDDFEVTGVFADLPNNTHLKFDAIMSFATLNKWWNDPITSWMWDGFFTYIVLDEKADPAVFEAKLPAFVEKQAGEELKRYNAQMVFRLQPVSAIHLDSDFIGEWKANGDRESTYFLGLVAVLIMVIAWVNYVNLATAKSIERAREVGVRKVMGGMRRQLIQQFIFESLLLNVAAVLIALTLVIALTPWFGGLTGRDLDYLLFRQQSFWMWLLLLIAIGTLVSGLYPAFVLSAYKPVDVLKGRFKNSHRGVSFRKGMVILQFVASITLIVGTFTVYRQIRFMQSQELGVDIDQVLVLQSPGVTDSTYETKFQVFKNALLQFPEVANVSASTSVPGRQPEWNAGGIRRLNQRDDEANQYRVIMMDHDFIPGFGLETVAGRPFSGEAANEWKSVMLNESGAKLMGFNSVEEAIDEQIFFWGDTFRIVGVVKNYHQESLKKSVEPLVFRYNAAPGGYYSVRFNSQNVHGSLARFEEQWKAVFPGNPFIHFFLDDHYNQQYQADQRFGNVFAIFSGLGIFIAVLGLFGLSSLTAIQRTKEIGVRKVLGASISSILTLITRDYLVLMTIAIVIAIPVSWWVMSRWLEAFATRIPLSWWLFIIPGMLVSAIALATVSIHTLRAARTDPAKSLRYE